MMCEWCGTNHQLTQLCRSNRPGVSRRKFFFLFGAGVAGAVLAPQLLTPAPEQWVQIGELMDIGLPTMVHDPNFIYGVLRRGTVEFSINFADTDGRLANKVEKLGNDLRVSVDGSPVGYVDQATYYPSKGIIEGKFRPVAKPDTALAS